MPVHEVQPPDSLKMLDLANQYEGELLTYEQLAQKLGVSIADAENVTKQEILDLANACFGVQTNEKVLALSKAEQIKVTATAAAALDHLVYGY